MHMPGKLVVYNLMNQIEMLPRILANLLIIICLLGISLDCRAASKPVPYTLAKNYFVLNTVGDGPLSDPVITTRERFDSLFGMATSMYENGNPTPIDFNKQFVIALVGKVTDQPEQYTVKKVEQKKSYLLVTCKVKTLKKQSYTSQGLQLLIIDRKYLQKASFLLLK